LANSKRAFADQQDLLFGQELARDADRVAHLADRADRAGRKVAPSIRPEHISMPPASLGRGAAAGVEHGQVLQHPDRRLDRVDRAAAAGQHLRARLRPPGAMPSRLACSPLRGPRLGAAVDDQGPAALFLVQTCCSLFRRDEGAAGAGADRRRLEVVDLLPGAATSVGVMTMRSPGRPMASAAAVEAARRR
jgi:hypothetical protein